MTDGQVNDIAIAVVGRLSDEDKDGFDISMITEIIQMIMDALENCNPSRRRRVLSYTYNGLGGSGWRERFWRRRAERFVQRTVGDLTTAEVTGALVDEFGNLEPDDVSSM